MVVVVANREGPVEQGFADWHCVVVDLVAGAFEIEAGEVVELHVVFLVFEVVV